MNREALEKKLNGISFEECSGVLMGDALHFALTENVSFSQTIISAIRIIKNEFFDTYKTFLNGTPKTAYLFSGSYRSRDDFKSSFSDLAKSLQNYLLIVCDKYRVGKPKNSIYLIKKWNRKLRPIAEISHLERIYIISIIHQLYCNYIEVDRIIRLSLSDFENIVSLCDVMPIDSFIIQKYKTVGAKTITLQHGTFNKGHYAYTHCKCDWFLAHSEFSKNNAILSGIEQEKIYIVGALNNLVNEKIEHNTKRNTIGILFCGSILTHRDIELIDMVKVYATKHEKDIIVKLHPVWGVDKYPSDCFDGIKRIYDEEIDVIDFANMTDWTVDDGSTVFIEYMSLQHPNFTYMHPENPYRDDTNVQMAFKDYVEMEDLFDIFEKHPDRIQNMIMENRKYLTAENPTIDSFKRFCFEVLKEA